MIGGRPARAIRQTVRQRIGRRSPAGLAQPDPVAAQRLDDGLAWSAAGWPRPPPRPARTPGRPAAAGCAGPTRPGSGPGSGRTRRAGSAGWRGGAPRSRRRSERGSRRPRPARPTRCPRGRTRTAPATPRRSRTRPAGRRWRPPRCSSPDCCGPGRRPGSGASSGAGAGAAVRVDHPGLDQPELGDRRRTRRPSGPARRRMAARRRHRGRTADPRPPAEPRHCDRRECPGSPARHSPGRRAADPTGTQPLPTTTTSRSTSRWASRDRRPRSRSSGRLPMVSTTAPKAGRSGAVIAAGTKPGPPRGGRPR